MAKSDRLPVPPKLRRSEGGLRILESRRLERLVPRLHPEALHQVIQRRGLEACADIVALATPEQLARVFDLDLWHSAQPGLDETLDADRFGLWLEVLLESGTAVAAEKLMAVDSNLVTSALAQHLRVFDRTAVARTGFEIGNYVVEPKRTASWDAIVALLLHLDSDHHDYFNRVMSGCRRLSNAGFEVDGLDNLPGTAEQELLDLAFEREERREGQGYVTPAQARAFLQLARERPHDDADRRRSPIAAAYFRTLDRAPGLVRAAGDMPSERALEELAFVANSLIAGGSIQGRAFTPDEASQAAAAICKLGAENSPCAEHEIVKTFEIGWKILYQDVCLASANRLLSVLADVRIEDPEIQGGLDALRRDLATSTRAGEPWRARDALDVIMIFDMTAWATLLELIAECPVIHAAMRAGRSRTVSASDFAFISANAQLALVRNFLDAFSLL